MTRAESRSSMAACGQPLPDRTAVFPGFSGTTGCCYAPFGANLDYTEPVTGLPMNLSVMIHYTWDPDLMRETHYFIVNLGRSLGIGQPSLIYYFGLYKFPRDDMCFPNIAIPISNSNLLSECLSLKNFAGLGPGTCGFSGQGRVRGYDGTATLSFIP